MGVDESVEGGDRREKGANLVFLNRQKLDALKARPGERPTDFWDRGIRGFGVRVYPSGRKTFTVRYCLHGKQLRKSIGVYQNEKGIVGGEIGYSEARAEAERIVSEARHGRDPFISAVLLKKADISTFEGLCHRYLKDPAPGRKGRLTRVIGLCPHPPPDHSCEESVDQITLIGSLPESPHRGALERALRHTVGAHAGRREIRIRHVPQTSWCLLRMKRSSDGFTCIVLLDPYEEPLETVTTRLIEALKHDRGASISAAGH